MNRIILVGNGFDLAHGLKTSYKDFIEWYLDEWGKLLRDSKKQLEEDRFYSFKLRGSLRAASWSYACSYCVDGNPERPWSNKEILSIAKQQEDLCTFNSKSDFFEKICDHLQTKNWVDIEDIFYVFLKKSLVPKNINGDLEFIKGKLIEYLNTIKTPSVNSIIRKQILSPISKEEIAIESKTQWEEMIKERLNYDNIEWNNLFDGYYSDYGSKRAAESSIEHFKSEFETEIRSGIFDTVMESICPAFRLPNNIMLLDFDYTNTTDLYLPRADKFTVNHIHGRLSNPEGVIFGYGDELDNSFKELLDKNNNEYLRNIKSIKYLEVPNYRNMLRFIESSPYQIYIMGHSCGNSDRTMLNTLFEHRNCVSIKPFYHKWDDGTDNYMEIVQNIARNFTDMKLMRDRVVNKTFCETI